METPGQRNERSEVEYGSAWINVRISAREGGVTNNSSSIDSKIGQPFDFAPPWLETHAVVTACHYEFARMNALTLGITSGSNRFLISFTYYAHAKTFSGEFTSSVVMEQGTSFPIFYNPLNPEQNRQSQSVSTSMPPLFAIGIAGSIVISVLYLAMMHGCN
jgi:hypothetical protein